jgi:3-oxoacyl-[acyl-carrier protein] reductase
MEDNEMDLNIFSLEGMNILVTGSSTGMGAAAAEGFAKAGASMVGVHYNKSKEEAKATVAHVEEAGSKALLLQADVTKEDQARAMATKFVEAAGGVMHVLMNNAGDSGPWCKLEDMTTELWRHVFKLNVDSLMWITQTCLPALKAANGATVINVGSIAGRNGGGPGGVTYAAAKATTHYLTMGWAKELSPYKIRVNGIAPGVIETPFQERHSSQEKLAEVASRTPLNRNGRAVDVVGACILLASNAGSFMTGETIDINGGLWFR